LAVDAHEDGVCAESLVAGLLLWKRSRGKLVLGVLGVAAALFAFIPDAAAAPALMLFFLLLMVPWLAVMVGATNYVDRRRLRFIPARNGKGMTSVRTREAVADPPLSDADVTEVRTVYAHLPPLVWKPCLRRRQTCARARWLYCAKNWIAVGAKAPHDDPARLSAV